MSNWISREMLQIGCTVNDASDSMSKFSKVFHIPEPNPEYATRVKGDETVYRGKVNRNIDLLGLSQIFASHMMIELVEPMKEEASAWDDFLQRRGEGIHHFAFFAEDIEKAFAEAKADGWVCTQKGKLPGCDGGYANMEHPDLPWFYTELFWLGGEMKGMKWNVEQSAPYVDHGFAPWLDEFAPRKVSLMVKDLKSAKAAFERLYDFPEAEVMQHENSYEAVYQLDNMLMSIYTPRESSAFLNQWMDEKGEGFNQLTFEVKDLDKSMELAKQEGLTVAESEEGKYAYLTTPEIPYFYIAIYQNS